MKNIADDPEAMAIVAELKRLGYTPEQVQRGMDRLVAISTHPLDGKRDEGGNAVDQIKGTRH